MSSADRSFVPRHLHRAGRAPALAALLLAAGLASCASHNAHRIRVDPRVDLEPLISEAFVEMTNDFEDAMPVDDLVMAVDIDPVDVSWLLYDGAKAPEGAVDSEALRRRIEDQFVRLLGPALVDGDSPEVVDAAGYLFNAWLLIDLRAMDSVTIQITCALTHRDEPGWVLAAGSSKLLKIDRLPCFGCREHWFRRRGTRLGGFRYDGHGSGVYFFGWFGGSHFGHVGHGHYYNYSRPTYVKR